MTQEEVQRILDLADAVNGDTSNHEMWAALTPEVVKTLCRGYFAWLNYE